jgi:hypothetical protein
VRWRKAGLKTRQGSLIEWLGLGVLLYRHVECSEVVEGHGHIRILGTQEVLLPRQRLATGIAAAGVFQATQVVIEGRHLRVVGTKRR